MYGGIEGFREIIKEVATLSKQDMEFVCLVFGLKKEELRCYTRMLRRNQHLNSWRSSNQKSYYHLSVWQEEQHCHCILVIESLLIWISSRQNPIDCITHAYDYLQPPFVENDFRLYSCPDIIAMKLSAISDNGTRLKDFIDIACLSTRYSFMEMLQFYQRKFPNSNSMRPFKAITYFEDIDFEEDIVMLKGVYSWELVADRLRSMSIQQEKVFSKLPLSVWRKRSTVILLKYLTFQKAIGENLLRRCVKN